MSIFNPYILLAVVLAIVGSFGGGYYKGSKDEVTRQQLEIAALNGLATTYCAAMGTIVVAFMAAQAYVRGKASDS